MTGYKLTSLLNPCDSTVDFNLLRQDIRGDCSFVLASDKVILRKLAISMSTPTHSSYQASWWKRVAVRAFFVGFGLFTACALAIAGYFIYQHHEETIPWTSPMKATFTGLDTRQPKDAVVFEFQYAIENTTDKDYQFPYNAAIMLLLPKGAGYRSGEKANVTWDKNVFIPARQKVNITVVWTVTSADYTLPTKEAEFVPFSSKRLIENAGFAIFDQKNRYRTDLPRVWDDWPDVKKTLEKEKPVSAILKKDAPEIINAKRQLDSIIHSADFQRLVPKDQADVLGVIDPILGRARKEKKFILASQQDQIEYLSNDPQFRRLRVADQQAVLAILSKAEKDPLGIL